MNGYAGYILRVDLTTRSVKKQKLDERLAKDYIGGRGFVDKVVFDRAGFQYHGRVRSLAEGAREGGLNL